MGGLSFRALSEHSMDFCGIDGAVAIKLPKFLHRWRSCYKATRESTRVSNNIIS